MTLRINLGCGPDVRPGWINVDRRGLPGVDLQHDLDAGPLPFADGSVDEVLCRDVLEHVDCVRVVEEIHRVLRPGGRLRVRVPHFSSHNVWDDPTHRRGFGLTSFETFVRGGRRNGITGAAFSRCEGVRLEFERSVFLPWNRLVEPLANRIPWPRYLYEGTALCRLFPAENVRLELVK